MIMTNVQEEHNIKVCICDRNIKGLQFTDGIDALVKREKKLEQVSRGSRIPPASVTALYIK